jgi:hypothetical protein
MERRPEGYLADVPAGLERGARVSTTTRVMQCDAESVWAVLADGWLYPLFVVGASRMREVDESWPAAGSRLLHSVGAWPALLDDATECLECEPASRLRLSAHAWPSGRAEVTFTLRETARATEVTLEEDAASGPARLVPGPVRSPLLHWRNTETLRRLSHLAEGRVGNDGTVG